MIISHYKNVRMQNIPNFISKIGMHSIQISIIHDILVNSFIRSVTENVYHNDIKHCMALNTMFGIVTLFGVS